MQFPLLPSWVRPGALWGWEVSPPEQFWATFQGQWEEKGFSLPPWEVMTPQKETRLSPCRAGASRDQGTVRSRMHEPHSLSRAVLWPPPGSRMSPDSVQPLKVTGPESIALILNWASEPCPVAVWVWTRAGTLQEKQTGPFAF